MPAAQQAKLLRVLETGEFQRVGSSKVRKVNVRILSATNADIQVEVEEGNFREDLLYRLNTVEIHLPPLRQRREDIPLLAAHFLDEVAAHYGKEVEEFSAEAMKTMLDYSWPGNIRELQHTVERAVLMTQGETIEAKDLGLQPRQDGASRLEEMTLEDAERYLIRKALHRNDGNVSQAAEVLGLSRSALYRRLERYDIEN